MVRLSLHKMLPLKKGLVCTGYGHDYAHRKEFMNVLKGKSIHIEIEW